MHDHLDVVRIAHDVGADEDVDHRQHEGVDQIREQQDPHVVRIGEEVPVFAEEACSCSGVAKSLEDLLNREARAADDAVGGTVVQRHRVAVDDVAVGEDDVAEEAGALVIGEWVP